MQNTTVNLQEVIISDFPDISKGVVGYGLTTPSSLIVSTKEVVKVECVEIMADLGIEKVHFLSVSIDPKKYVEVRGKKRQYGLLSQECQYYYIRRTLMKDEILSDIIQWGVFVFEQHKIGNIHFHIICKSAEHPQNIRSHLASIFNISKWAESMESLDIKPVVDPEGMYDYLFYKTTKTWEIIDQSKFPPLRLLKNNIFIR
jgi:hypothetical protein